MRGVLFSLPELFWVNIRKGTFEYGIDQVERLAPTMRARRPAPSSPAVTPGGAPAVDRVRTRPDPSEHDPAVPRVARLRDFG